VVFKKISLTNDKNKGRGLIMAAEIIAEGVYLIGGPNLSHPNDAASFIIDFAGELVMIDAGAGRSSKVLQKNIEDAGLNPKAISTLILTHCHIDHIGSAPYFREHFGCKLLIHDLDAADGGNKRRYTVPPDRLLRETRKSCFDCFPKGPSRNRPPADIKRRGRFQKA
jgi:glyoxylase-like metal-dependent hydrolase (beta-lactamase superfamily II)